MLVVENLTVRVNGKEIVKGVSFELDRGLCVLMGPNGAGKSTLARALIGDPDVDVSGRILLDGRDITNLPPEERFRLGLFLGFQIPPEIKGIKVKDLLERVSKKLGLALDYDRLLTDSGLSDEFLEREVNVEFSGGERKKLEVLQLLAFRPRFAILDELDSGMDVDTVMRIGKLLEKCKKDCGILVITHTTNLVKFARPDKVMIMVNGKIVEVGDYNLAKDLEREGYSRWLNGLVG